MVTKSTNTVYNCATCAEPKHRHHRTHEWIHLRGDSLCSDDREPVVVRLSLPGPRPASDALLDALR